MTERGAVSSWAAAAVLVVVAIAFVFPFAWMALATFKANPEIFRPFPLLPARYALDAHRTLFDDSVLPFERQLVNSTVVAVVQTTLVLAVCIPAGYAFALHRFRGRRTLYALALATVVLPPQALALPLFTWIARLGLYDSLPAVILPGVASGLGLVFFTLAFRRVPPELPALARSEGASEARVLLTLLPLLRPAVLAYALIHFVLCWHEHLIPLILLGSPETKTAPLGLASLYGSSVRFPYAVLMAGSLVSTLPTLVAYAALRKHFESAIGELAAS